MGLGAAAWMEEGDQLEVRMAGVVCRAVCGWVGDMIGTRQPTAAPDRFDRLALTALINPPMPTHDMCTQESDEEWYRREVLKRLEARQSEGTDYFERLRAKWRWLAGAFCVFLLLSFVFICGVGW